MNAPRHSRTFKAGNSEAVRLPKGVGFGIGTEVVIERRGDEVVLRAARDPAAEKARIRRLLDRLAEIGPVGEVGPREPIEFPDRPGLY
jgi:antitoxin VapB